MPVTIRTRFITLFLLLAIITILPAALTAQSVRADTNYALAFNGSPHYVTLPAAATLFNNPAWVSTKTVSAWIYPDPAAPAAPAINPASGEVILATDRPRTFGITRANFNGLDRIWVYNADSNGTDLIPVEYTPGTWLNIAIVHDAGTLTVYKNGVLVSAIPSGASAYTTGTFYMGGSGRSGATTYFKGLLDEARFWNVALDQGTIAAWLAGELTPAHPNYASLAAYYRMSAGLGTTLPDDSGLGQTGILLGGMGDPNWVLSTAFEAPPTATPNLPTDTPLPPTDTPSPTATATAGPPTDMPTPTASATVTDTPLPPTDTPSPTATATAGPPTDTPTPTATATVTNTSLPPTDTPSPTATATAGLPTDTPTPTATAEPPTNTPSPTATSIPPTATPTPTSPPVGNAGYALAFDGNNDFVELNETRLIMAPGWENTKSVELWVLPLGPLPTCQYETPAWCDAIFGDRARWWGISRGVIGGADRIWAWNYDGSPGSSVDMVGVDYTPGEWVHITLVHENGMLKIYKNGLESGSTSSGTTLQPGSNNPILHLGGVINTATRNWTFEGQLDEVQIWNIARLPAEVQQTLYTPLNGNEPGLAAYYQMSNGLGLVLTDDSQFSWNGLLYDGARGVPPDGSPPQWVISTAFDGGGPAPTPTATFTPGPPTATPTATNTPLPATATATPLPTATPTNTVEPGSGAGYSLAFNGTTNYAALPSAATLFNNPAWVSTKTVSAWIYPDPAAPAAPAINPASGEVILATDRPRTFGITRANFNGLDRIWVYNADSNGTDLIPVDYTPGTWLNVAVVHDAGTLTVYKNGILVSAIPSGASSFDNSPFYLGGSGRSGATTYFQGQLDEARFWNAALSQGTIAAWLAGELTPAHPNYASLAAYYRMSAGVGTTLPDDSGHSQSGFLLGGMNNSNWVPFGLLFQ